MEHGLCRDSVPRRGAVKKLLIGLGAIVVVIILAAIAVPFLVPVDAYKGKIVALVKDATGRDLRIDGPIKLSLFPNLALEATDVALANAPGGVAKDMVRLKTLDVNLKLWPLLRGAIAIDRFVLVDPVIALEIDKQGRPNWAFETPAKQTGAATPAPSARAGKTGDAAGGSASFTSLRLDDVRLVNGTVSYLDQRSGKKETVASINMKLSLPDLASPFAAEGSAVWNGEKLTLTADLAKPGALGGGGASPVSVKLASALLNADFEGTATGATFSKLAGTVDLNTPSLRRLAQWAGSPLAASGSGFGPLAIKGKLDVAGPKIAFSDAAISLDAIKGQGALTLDRSGARPYLKGHLALATLDLNPYLPAEGQSSAPPAPSKPAAPSPAGTGKLAAAGWSDAPLDLSGLKLADADFDLTADALVYRKITIGKSALALHLKDGRFTADLKELALYQGKGQGKVVADGSGAVPRIEASLNLANVQVGPLLRDAAGLGWLNGTGAFDMSVAGQGRSQREIVGALNGKGSLNLANGVIKGVNLVGMIKNAAAAVAGQQSGGETDFATLSATYTIANGVLRSNDLRLKSAEVPMEGAGTVDLPRRTVDFRVTPRLAGVLAVPILIRGPWDNLHYEPDLAAIVADPAKLLGGAASSGAQDIGKAVKGAPNPLDALKGLLGR
jgi:AsmA protein